jgi:hypothetical protein
MKLMRRAHIVVVADSDHAYSVVARLQRMEVARVTAVAGYAEAQRLCEAGSADVCVVIEADFVPDGKAGPFRAAPGLAVGVPSLVMVPTVTLFQRRSARGAGYHAAVAANIAPRMLYRRLRAALQGRRAGRRTRRRLPPAAGLPFLAAMPGYDKPTLH